MSMHKSTSRFTPVITYAIFCAVVQLLLLAVQSSVIAKPTQRVEIASPVDQQILFQLEIPFGWKITTLDEEVPEDMFFLKSPFDTYPNIQITIDRKSPEELKEEQERLKELPQAIFPEKASTTELKKVKSKGVGIQEFFDPNLNMAWSLSKGAGIITVNAVLLGDHKVKLLCVDEIRANEDFLANLKKFLNSATFKSADFAKLTDVVPPPIADEKNPIVPERKFIIQTNDDYFLMSIKWYVVLLISLAVISSMIAYDLHLRRVREKQFAENIEEYMDEKREQGKV